MATDPFPIGEDLLRQALTQMQSALELLDRSEVSAHIGAHLDLAICELESAIGVASAPQDRAALASRTS